MGNKAEMTQTKLPAGLACPHCYYRLEFATIVIERNKRTRPRPGDITLCLRCQRILVFTEGLNVRATRPGENFDQDPAIRNVRAVMRRAKMLEQGRN